MKKSQIKQILIDHQKLFEYLDDSIKRDLNLKQYFKSNQIIVISGIRRCGKSTLMKSFSKIIDKKAVYIRFDDIRFVNFQIEDFTKIEELIQELFGEKIFLCLDEIQEIKGWEKWVNGLHAKKYLVIVTGSNSKLLSSEFSTYLTGRHKVIKLFPFSFKELVNKQDLEYNKLTTENIGQTLKLFNEYFDIGGFPDVFINKDQSLLNQYMEDILIKDVIVRHNIKQKKELRDLVLNLISNASKTFSYRTLKNITGIQNFSTIKNYIDAVSETYLFYLLTKYDVSVKKQLNSSSKVYVADIGFLNYSAFRFSENSGRNIENLVFLELKRNDKEIYYHKDKKECDFVIKKGLKIVDAIQVCYELNSENEKREIAGLMDAINKYELKEGLILTYDQEEVRELEGKKIFIKPVWKWLLEP